MSAFVTKGLTIALLLADSLAAVKLLYTSGPSVSVLIPFLTKAREVGEYHGGIPLRTYYTGIPKLDLNLAGFVGFFSMLVDGRDEASQRFACWFLPQMLPILIFMFWEGGKAQSIFIKL